MEYTIGNGQLSVTVRTLGGSLCSVKDQDGTEYLWQGNPAYWRDQAPNLFPYIARMTEGKYTLDGQEYHMDIHGFVKDSELEAAECEKSRIRLRLEDNEKTHSQYPYHFSYDIEYGLEGNRLAVVYRVVNRDEKTMYFGIGGHPGFNVPLEDGLGFEDYELRFDGGDGASSQGETRRVGFSPACFVTGTTPYALGAAGVLPLRHELFDDDAIVLTGVPARVCLQAKNGRKAVRVSYPQMTYLGIWHKPHSDAPYVCIEPWSSLPSRDGIVEDLAKQPGLIALGAGETYENRWEIEILCGGKPDPMKAVREQMEAHMKKEQANKVHSYRSLNRVAQKGQILFTGSSLMEQFPVAELAASHGLGKTVYNRGIGGTTTEDFLREIDTVLFDLEPATVFINIGTNDIREWDDGRDWLESLLANYEEILKQCRKRLPETKVYVMAYYPVNAGVDLSPGVQGMLKVRTNANVKLANGRVAEVAARYGCEYIDVNEGLTDAEGNLKAEYTIEGVHMYAEAYEVVYRNLEKYLIQ